MIQYPYACSLLSTDTGSYCLKTFTVLVLEESVRPLNSVYFRMSCTHYFRLASIHADAPEFVEMSVKQEILVTGIKVVDLLAPYAKGGKIGKVDCVGSTHPH